MSDEPVTREKASSESSSAALVRYVEPLLLIIFGTAGVADGWRIITTNAADTPGGLEAGGWIAALGGLLIIGACVHIALDARRAREVQPASEAGTLYKPPAVALTLLLLYIALLPPLGYVLATALFMAAYLRIFGSFGSLIVAAIAVPFAVGSGWLWSALNMTLPQGVLPWP